MASRPIHFGHGYSGNGVAPSVVGGRILAALAIDRRDDPALALPLVGMLPRAFPPEPFRYVGARVVREAIVRVESAEERAVQPNVVLREISRLPRRLGYHLDHFRGTDLGHLEAGVGAGRDRRDPFHDLRA